MTTTSFKELHNFKDRYYDIENPLFKNFVLHIHYNIYDLSEIDMTVHVRAGLFSYGLNREEVIDSDIICNVPHDKNEVEVAIDHYVSNLLDDIDAHLLTFVRNNVGRPDSIMVYADGLSNI